MLSRLSCLRVSLLMFAAGLGIAQGVSASGASEFTARLSYLEDDVRVSLGKKGEPRINKEWVRAFPGMDLEEGYSIATEEGNAEIELENGSTIYLAPHSLLIFYELVALDMTAWGIPEYDRARLGLVTGSAIVLSQFRDGLLVIQTPTGRLQANTPALVRVTSHLNGTEAVHFAIPAELATRATAKWGPARFVAYGNVDVKREGSVPESQWASRTKARVLERVSLTVGALRASGFDEPFDGLLDLYRNGKFEACGSEETCWSPSEKALAALPTPEAQAPQTSGSSVPGPHSPGSQVLREWDGWEEVPCLPVWTHNRLWRDANGKIHHDVQHPSPAVSSLLNFRGYDSWVSLACTIGRIRSYQNRRYVVLRRKHEHGHHHHHHEVRTQWVKLNGQVGLMRVLRTVPKDDKMMDTKDGVYLMPKRPGESVRHTDAVDPVKLHLLDTPPKEYRPKGPSELERVGKPVITAQFVETNPKVQATPGTILASTLRQTTYDYARHGFAIEGETKSARNAGAVIVARMSSDGGLYAPGGRNSVQGVVANSRVGFSGGGGSRDVGGGLFGTASGAGSHLGGLSGGSSHSGGFSGGASTGSSHAPGAATGGSSYSPSSGGGAGAGAGGRPH